MTYIMEMLIQKLKSTGKKIAKSKTTYYILKVANHPITLAIANTAVRAGIIIQTLELIRPDLHLIRRPNTPILRKIYSAVQVANFGLASTSSLLANIMNNSPYAPQLKTLCMTASGMAVSFKPLSYELCLLYAAHGNDVSPYLLLYSSIPTFAPLEKPAKVIIPSKPNYPLIAGPSSYLKDSPNIAKHVFNRPNPSVSKVFEYLPQDCIDIEHLPQDYRDLLPQKTVLQIIDYIRRQTLPDSKIRNEILNNDK